MKKCELCNSLAKMYCESDQATLCWDCDSRVHGANFLVAKHSRTLLCHLCQSPTPWNGSGPKLGPTVSVCDSCVNRSVCREERNNEVTPEEDEDDDDEEDDNDVDDEDEDENGSGDDDEENQVVPWSSTPRDSSFLTSEECSTGFGSSAQEFPSQSRTVNTLKRIRETVEPVSRDDDIPAGCSFSAQHYRSMNSSNESTFFDAFPSLKDQKITSRDSLRKGVAAGDL